MAALAKVQKARMRMLIQEAFFGTLAMNLELVEDDKAADIWTDGKSIAFNPIYVEAAKDSEVEALIAKCVMHCANFHTTRRGNRDVKEWQKACSYAVNPYIRDAGFKLPAGSLFRADFEGYGAEEIFSKMKAEKRKEEEGKKGAKDGKEGQQAPGGASGQQGKPGAPGAAAAPGNGTPGAGQSGAPGKPGNGTAGDTAGPGEVRDGAPSHEPAALKEMEIDWTVRTRQGLAAARKKGAGTLPGHLEQLDVDTIAPRIDWKSELRNFIDRASVSQASWLIPNRRYIGAGLILPGKVAAAISHMVFVIDVSASIDQDALAAFKAENSAAFEDGMFDRVTVIYCNTAVTGVAEFERGDVLKMETKAGGSTRFSPAFRWIENNAPDAAAVVYFTDLDSTDFGPAPEIPVLWAAYGDSKVIAKRAAAAPFGDTIYLAA